MGVPKVLLPAGEGHTLLSRVLETSLLSVDGPIIIVLGRDAELCRADIQRFLRERPQHQARAIPVENPHYAEGLSTSLRCGVQEVMRLESSPSGLMVFLADQPALSNQQARDLIRAFKRRRADTVAVAAAEGGEQRNPVIFSADLLSELLEVEGDRGARGILKRYAGRVERLELGSGPWFTDTDDWATYAELTHIKGWLEEVDIPEFSGDVSEEMVGAILRRLRRDPRPLLRAGVLLVGSKSDEIGQPVRLSQPAVGELTASGIQTVIVGSGEAPEDYLYLLRRAAFWTLRRSPS